MLRLHVDDISCFQAGLLCVQFGRAIRIQSTRMLLAEHHPLLFYFIIFFLFYFELYFLEGLDINMWVVIKQIFFSRVGIFFFYINA